MAPVNMVFAAVSVDLSAPASPVGQSSGLSGWRFADVWMVAGVVLALAVLLFVWAKYVRRPDHRAHAEAEPPLAGPTRRRKVRQEHRPRKPTLAETGGLPPLRNAGSPERPPSP